MRIAFYAPLKSPEHPVPSGDRLMARLLMRALEHAGHQVSLVSELRIFLGDPHDIGSYRQVVLSAARERARLATSLTGDAKPDLWFTYHPYYKSPDLLGPELAALFSIPYVTAEASYSRRRSVGVWAETQQWVSRAVGAAALNLCFTRRDREGLADAVPQARLEMLAPFIDPTPFGMERSVGDTTLVTLAMMRNGDKLNSFRMLAKTLESLHEPSWRLTVIGDGPARPEVELAFSPIPAGRITWRGEISPNAVPATLAQGGIYVWPGCGEAYGLAYLEAQAAGLPVVAQLTAGVPEVVLNDETGLLTPDGDVEAYRAAITTLLGDGERRREMGDAARRFVLEERSLTRAATRLRTFLDPLATAA